MVGCYKEGLMKDFLEWVENLDFGDMDAWLAKIKARGSVGAS